MAVRQSLLRPMIRQRVVRHGLSRHGLRRLSFGDILLLAVHRLGRSAKSLRGHSRLHVAIRVPGKAPVGLGC